MEFTDEESSILVNDGAFEWTEWNVETVGVAKSYAAERERAREGEREHSKSSSCNYDVIVFMFMIGVN